MVLKPVVNNGKNYHINWLAGFLNHQQYGTEVSPKSDDQALGGWFKHSAMMGCFLVPVSPGAGFCPQEFQKKQNYV